MVGYKLNTDGYSRGNPSPTGRGSLVQDGQGHFIFGYSCSLGPLTSLHAELKAMFFSVRQCVLQGYHDLHVETDSQILANMI